MDFGCPIPVSLTHGLLRPYPIGLSHSIDHSSYPDHVQNQDTRPLSFPLLFVFHRAGFMLPVFHIVEPSANHPETASVTCSPASRRSRSSLLFIWFIWFLWSIWFPWTINQRDQMNKTNQTNTPRRALLALCPTDQTNSPRRAFPASRALLALSPSPTSQYWTRQLRTQNS